MIDIYDTEDEASRHFKAMEGLSIETRYPLDNVKRIYEDEFLRLKSHARIKDYLVLLTSRKVRDQLRWGRR